MGDISLRELAAALGTSHRMLIYHFGSKEGLFVESRAGIGAAGAAGAGRAVAASDGRLEDVIRQFWLRLRSPELAANERLFFELYTQALQGREYAKSVLDGVVDDWLGPGGRRCVTARGLDARGRPGPRPGSGSRSCAACCSICSRRVTSPRSTRRSSATSRPPCADRPRTRALTGRVHAGRGCAGNRQPLPWI